MSSERPWRMFALVGALAFLVLRMRFSSIPLGSLKGMYDGTATLPFQYRDLVPLLVHGIVWATGLQGGLDHVTIYFAFEFLATVGSLFAGLALLRRLGVTPAWIAVLYVMILGNYVFGGLDVYYWLYDLPALFFMTFGLVLLLDENWPVFYALLPLAILNRETAVSLVVVFSLVNWWRMPMRRYVKHLSAQVGIVLIVKAALWWAFRNNSGLAVSFYDPLSHTWRFVLNWRFLHFPEALTIFGFMWVPFLLALPRLRDPFFRRAVWLIPPFMAGMFLVGDIWEFRIFTETLPIILAVTADGLRYPNRAILANGPGLRRTLQRAGRVPTVAPH